MGKTLGIANWEFELFFLAWALRSGKFLGAGGGGCARWILINLSL